MDRTVLIVDDDNFTLYINQEIIAPLISKPLLTYLEAKQALKFLDQYLSESSEVLIFLDLNMPEINGWQFLDELKISNFRKNISVIIVTSSVDERDSVRAFQYCFVRGFIVKPVGEESVLELSRVDQISSFFNPA